MKIISKPIDMIASFNEEGTPRPLKFRMKNSEQVSIVIKIDRILLYEKQKKAGIESLVFRCQSCFENIERLYELRYTLSDCKWVLYKI
ncbi:hypothetical protein Amet_1745 [Alkaliphilus metalliredigens QYMF]|uniref:Uncharacterized protein n=1 Tax=Alkaliphilus metalliredigens (strain QYMF) TaxID=293826 RepID=A6TP01_ALKMQ|nr:hypothetical protein [Alkaliphilus metalliredigens]ABR47919.1 hypothetical protein Amet_1745 [Alkaliphilus metalliredigens QYMF]